MEQHTSLELERMQMMLLSTHFTLGEFLRSGTAIKYGIDNTPHDSLVIVRLMTLCEQVLEPLRQHCGIITITSGYRCPQLNLAVHGVPASQHTLGEAADIFIPNEETLKKYTRRTARTAPMAARELHHASLQPPSNINLKHTPNLKRHTEL